MATVAIEAASTSLTAGDSLQLRVVLRDAAGHELEGRIVSYASSNPLAATVSATGLVRARAPGQVTITATSEGKSGIMAMTVSAVPVARVELSPSGATIEVGETVQLTATARTVSGGVVSGCAFSFSSADDALARVQSVSSGSASRGAAIVTGLAVGGPVAIVASAACDASGGAEGAAQIHVVAATAGVVGSVVEAAFGTGIHAATVTISGLVERTARTSGFNPGDFQFLRLPPGTYTVTAAASFDIGFGRFQGTFVADCESVTIDVIGGETKSLVITCAFPTLTGFELNGGWSAWRNPPEQIGRCAPALPRQTRASMAYDPIEGTIRIGALDPEVTIDGPYDASSGRFQGEGRTVFGDGSWIWTTLNLTFGFVAFDPLFDIGYQLHGEMTRRHWDPNGNVVCTETYRVSGSA